MSQFLEAPPAAPARRPTFGGDAGDAYGTDYEEQLRRWIERNKGHMPFVSPVEVAQDDLRAVTQARSDMQVVEEGVRQGFITISQFDQALSPELTADGRLANPRLWAGHVKSLADHAIVLKDLEMRAAETGGPASFAVSTVDSVVNRFAVPLAGYVHDAMRNVASSAVGATSMLPTLEGTPDGDELVQQSIRGWRSKLGLPLDAAERAFLLSRRPLATVSGDLMAIGLESLVLPNPIAAISRIPKLAGLLTRAPRLAVAIPAGTAAGLLGWEYGSLLGAEDPTYIDKAENAVAGVGGAFILSTVLTGRKRNVLVAHMLNEQAKLGGLAKMGWGVRLNPRLTTGSMLGTAFNGGVISLADAESRGADAEHAIVEGVRGGLNWVAADMLFGMVGSTARWAAQGQIAERRLGEAITKYPFYGLAAELGLGTTAGGALGASIEDDAGENYLWTGVAAGAGAGVALHATMRGVARLRGAGVLSDKSLTAVLRGDWGVLSPDEKSAVVDYLLRSEVRGAVTESGTDATNEVIRRTVLTSLGAAATKTSAELDTIILGAEQELRAMLPNGVPTGVEDEAFMVKVLSLSRTISDAREIKARRVAHDTRVTDAQVRTQAEAVRDAFGIGSPAVPLRHAAEAAESGAVVGVVPKTSLVKAFGDTGVPVLHALAPENRAAVDLLYRWAADHGYKIDQVIDPATREVRWSMLSELDGVLTESATLAGLFEKRPDLFWRYGNSVHPSEVTSGKRAAAIADLVKSIGEATVESPLPQVATKVERDVAQKLATAYGERAAWSVDDVLTREYPQLAGARRPLVQPAVEVAGRKVAPSGVAALKSLLPDTITASAASKKPLAISEVKQWATTRGWTFEVDSEPGVGTFKFIMRDAAGKTIASDKSLVQMFSKRPAWAKSFLERADVERLGADTGEAGFIHRDALTTIALGVAGAGLGQFGAWALDEQFDSADDGGIAQLVGGVIGVGVGIALAKKNSKFRTTLAENALLRFVRVPEEQQYLPAVAEKLVGKAAVTELQHLRMPVAQQEAHLLARLKLTGDTKGIPLAGAGGELPRGKQERVAVTIKRFMPTEFTSPETYDRIHNAAFAAMQKAGFTPEQAALLWRGGLVRMSMGPAARLSRAGSGRIRLMDLGRRGTELGGAVTPEALRDNVLLADIVTGPQILLPKKGDRVNHRLGLAKMLTIEAQELKAIDAAAREISSDQVGGASTAETLMPFRPTLEALRTKGERFVLHGRNEAEKVLGQRVLAFVDSLNTALVTAQKMQQEFNARAFKIYDGLTTEEAVRLRDVVEGRLTTGDTHMNQRAQQVRELLAEYRKRFNFDAIAKQMGTTEDALLSALGIDNVLSYYPIAYNQESIYNAIRKGTFDRWSFYSDTGQPASKVFLHLKGRTTDGLAYARLHPLQELLTYIAGAERKLAIDPLLAQYGAEFWRTLGRDYRQPFIAKAGLTLMKDVVGIPRDSTVQVRAALINTGDMLERLAGMTHLEFAQEWAQQFADRYLYTPNSVDRLTAFARGMPAFMKLGGGMLSSLVNFGGMLANVTADASLADLFRYGGQYGGAYAVGASLDKLKRLPFIGPFLDLNAAGPAKYRLIRERGILADTSERLAFDGRYLYDPRYTEASVGLLTKSAVLGGVAGGAAGALTANEGAAPEGAIAGAATLSVGSILAPRRMRQLLHFGARAWMTPFTAAENMGRAVAFGASEGTTRTATQLATTAGAERQALLNRVGAQHVVESGLLGALAGGLTAAAGAEEGHRQEAAMWGGAVGAAIGALARGEAPVKRAAKLIEAKVARDTTRLEAATARGASLAKSLADPSLEPAERAALEAEALWNAKMKEALTFTREDLEAWYQQNIVDQSLFRFSKMTRPSMLRDPVGETMMALQTWTFNQAEFLGSRLTSFVKSLDQPGKSTAERIAGADMRFFRYMAALFAMSSVYSMAASGMDSDRKTPYWSSRLGLGLFAFVQYNESAESWGLVDWRRVVAGALLDDVFNVTKTTARLATDPIARLRWDEQLNELSKDLFSGLKQLEMTPDKLGAAAHSLGLEAVQEGLAQLVQPAVSQLTNPGVAGTSTAPPYPGQRVALPTSASLGGASSRDARSRSRTSARGDSR